jgi:hypothetical protein
LRIIIVNEYNNNNSNNDSESDDDCKYPTIFSIQKFISSFVIINIIFMIDFAF